jgi:nicotinate-nucleotide pyrophosphorylase (carboxylating)
MTMEVPSIDWVRVDQLIEMAINEDLASDGDVTTMAVINPEMMATAVLRCKEPGMMVAGIKVANRVFTRLDPLADMTVYRADGSLCHDGEIIAEITGKAQALLTAERTALNFLQRLSGIATMSARFAAALKGSRTVALDTRKTTPGFRNLEKYAVAVGGASNHRVGLYDRGMIKDNHRELAAMDGPGGIIRSVKKFRATYPHLKVEVEADTLEEVREALESGADYILLDNMSDELMAEAVKLNAGRAKLEASGGITLERLPKIAALGIDFVSSGALTHSVKVADISLDIVPGAAV